MPSQHELSLSITESQSIVSIEIYAMYNVQLVYIVHANMSVAPFILEFFHELRSLFQI